MEIMRNPLQLLFLVFSILNHACMAAGSEHDYGAHPRFICTPLPADADPSCFSTTGPGVGAPGPNGPGHQNTPPSSWWGVNDEAKATILHLRESLVQQKEIILDQREAIRELTAKLSMCEAFGRGVSPHSHHPDMAPHHPHTDEGHYSNRLGHHGNGNLQPDSPVYPSSAGGQKSDRGHGKEKHMTPGDSTSSMEQMEGMLLVLKERLDNLQAGGFEE